MNSETNDDGHDDNGASEHVDVPTEFLQRLCVMLVGMCVFLSLVNAGVVAQTASSSPVPPIASDVTQPVPVHNAVAASDGDGAATQEQPDGQPRADDQDAMFVFKTQVREVILHATVVDEQRRLVTNLDQPAFTAFENGAPQATTSFHREDVPVAMGIVIDNSGSMRENRDKVNLAVLNLIRAGNPNDQSFVVNFNRDSYLDQDFTSDIDRLQQALQKVSTQGSTALYDAIVASTVHLKNNIHEERKVLLVITDGRDNASRETLEEALRRLQQENGPTLYVIGLLGDGLKQSDTRALQSLAEVTGGVAYFPKRLDEVDEITRAVARDIHSQYTIGYKPSNHNKDGGYRNIEVRAQTPGRRKLTVRTRSGYYSGEAVH